MEDDTPTAEPANKPSTVRFALILALVLAALVAARVWWPADTTVDDSGVEAEEIDNPELGVTFTATGIESLPRQVIITCDEKMTVFEAFRHVVAVEPAWKFDYQGSGNLILVVGIAGRTNEGAAGNNWLYEVNGEMAARGVTEIEVGPGDHVLWKFQPYE